MTKSPDEFNPLYRPKDAPKVDGLHPDLARVIYRAAREGARFIVIQGQRGRAEQEKAKSSGHSNAHFGQSPHNFKPALGVDIGPSNYPGKVPDDYQRLKVAIFAAAKLEGVELVWGGDWKSLKDWPHFELKNWRAIRGKLAE